uniref:Pericentriolar material 1 protein C-terminal domain-containing protein n=1 Tax=Glossina morsitans morsitans TaxID=37546 RepID=A0A1B0FBP4_GLOMM
MWHIINRRPVAAAVPTPTELQDYLLTTVVTTANSINSNNNNNQQPSLVQNSNTINSVAGATNSDLENSQESQQRFCYPVRPIPRRSQQASHNSAQLQNDYLNSANINSNLNTAIGVVIPTTPGLPNSTTAAIIPPVSSSNRSANNSPRNVNLNQQLQQQLLLLQLQHLQQLFEEPQARPLLNLATQLIPSLRTSTSAVQENTITSQNSNEVVHLLQRLQQLQSLNTSNNSNNNSRGDCLTGNLEICTRSLQKSLRSPSMVHEINPNSASSSQREMVVNSASLEDVALSESSDRAQSIQSLHSAVETPTPDNTPSFEELQQRLEASNRNIENMKEQQQQLLRLQTAAKQHLNEMEKLRQQANTLSFPSGSQRLTNDTDGAPEYQSVEQIHTDMSSLVGRMKNLTAFIQNQNELSSLLGDDGPEILAEQEALQRKLEDLRNQRDEMRNLVTELQDINRSAEETAKEARQRQFEQEKDVVEQEPESPKSQQTAKSVKSNTMERVVPVEYTRVVPIELLQSANRHSNNVMQSESELDPEEDEGPAATVLIQQREADIDAMKSQLKRLKEMMETVNMIETHTINDPKTLGRTPPRESCNEFDRDRSLLVTTSSLSNNDSGNEEYISRKVRMLNEVTTDLRAQAESLQAERNRIYALKAEIERRKNQAAAAAQIGEEALKRSSLTPTPTPKSLERRLQEHEQNQEERDRLKTEYELKKKEFELLCQRLQDEQPVNETPSMRPDIVSEADDEAEEDVNDSDYAASAKFQPNPSTPAVSRNAPSVDTSSRQRNAKDSMDPTVVSSNTAAHIAQADSSTHDGASLEGASIQSGSSRSYSIPPPMSAMGLNFPGPIPPPLPSAWNPHQYYYGAGIPPPPPPPPAAFASGQTATLNNPPNGGDCICNANNLGAATSSSTTTATTNIQLNMLQQFVHTQQMLINSVCHCNQMLWHQQREIEKLNQTIHLLQDRILALTTGAAVNANISYNMRSESVPPPNLNGVAADHRTPNNLYVGLNPRAQSEQPPPQYMTAAVRDNTFSNYQHQQQHHIYQQCHQQRMSAGNFNFSTETQQHNAASTATVGIYSTLNNAIPENAVAQPPATLYNNEISTPQSPLLFPTKLIVDYDEQKQRRSATTARKSISNPEVTSLAAAAANVSTTASANQGNKVTPKQICHFRNRTEELNRQTQNPQPPTPVQQQQQQQQQQQHRYPNTLAGYRTQSYMNLPENRRLRNHDDFLLRPILDIEDNNYDFNNCNPLQLALDFSNSSNATEVNHGNHLHNISSNNIEEEEDTTSEEIKRNLLVNALKNDKFTTKFYESIKEDVFRRLESMLLDKDNTPGSSRQVINNISSNISMRKMYLNEQRGQLQQQQPLALNTTAVNDRELNAAKMNTETDLLMTSTDNSPLLLLNMDNEKPEEDCNWRHSVMNNSVAAISASGANAHHANTNLRPLVTGLTKNVTKKRKNQRKQTASNNVSSSNNNSSNFLDEEDENLKGACSLAAQQQNRQPNEKKGDENGGANNLLSSSSSTASTANSTCTNTNPNNYDLIAYIITRIRNQTHPNTHINDALLAEIAKLTATVVQNAQTVPSASNNTIATNGGVTSISPKKIYAKIKKLSLPRERDEFLDWYQQYLENNVFSNTNENHNNNTSKNKCNSQKAQNKSNNQTQIMTADDGDLAEADQNCSSASNNNNYPNIALIGPVNENVDNNNASKHESIEFENKENPDAENHDNVEGACALISPSLAKSEEMDKDFKTEKSNERGQEDLNIKLSEQSE